ncbi:MAG: ACT domain-containing protein [Clostridia bacterium]
MRAVLTVVGKDKKGIIYCVSKCLNELNINIEDISQTILQDFFTMIMIVDIKDSTSDFQTIQQKLQEVGENASVDIKIQHEDIFNSMHKL